MTRKIVSGILGSPARSGGGNAPPHMLRAISHASPFARQSKRILPFSEPLIIRSITRVPKPWRIGGLTGGIVGRMAPRRP